MRRHHWSAAVLALLAALAASREVLAQYDGYGEGPGRIQLAAEAQPRPLVPYDADWPAGEPGPTGNPYDPYATHDPRFAVQPAAFNSPLGTANIPPGALPYPAISPFENQFEQHTHEEGLWFNETRSDIYDGRKFFFGAAYLHSKIKQPNDRTVGSTDPRIQPSNVTQPDIFRAIKLGTAFRHDTHTNGLLVRWGYENLDETGLELQGFWYTEGTARYRRGTGRGDIIDFNYLRDTNGIPLYDGSANIGGFGVYDRLFLLTHATQSFGGNIDFAFTPTFKGDWYRIQATVGGTSFAIRQKFTFIGSDSNLGFVLTPGGSPIPGTVVPNPNGIPAYEAYFESTSDSYLFGPQAGLKYEMGGDVLRFLGSTRFGVAGNIERLNLQGRNIGDFFNIDYRQFNTGFDYREYNAHLSAVIQQSVAAEAPIFRLIPYVNRWHWFENAIFRVSYNYLWASEIARPEDNIEYRGFPLKPELRIRERSTWFTRSVGFEVDWTY